MLGRALALGRRALRSPPRYVGRRLAQELGRQLRRPWCRIRPRLLTERALLAAAGAASLDSLWERVTARPFFVAPGEMAAWREAFLDQFPDSAPAITREAEAVLRHEFDLLGSGPVRLGSRLPWHRDFKSGHEWPVRYGHDYDLNELDRPSDVKVPWELSRCQHFAFLGQAYWLSGDERYAREFVAETTDWLRANPWGYGINWAGPMDVALRAVSWVWALHFFARSRACASPEFRARLLQSLYLHGEFLHANVEIDEVAGNHYLADGVGLVFLGLLFRESRRGRRWLDTGRRIVGEAILEQVHEDGVDFEQSIAYHRLVLEACLTAMLLLRRHGEDVSPGCWTRLERMHDFVLAYTKPDGRAPLIGDADDGRVQRLGLQPLGDHRYLLSTGAVLFERGDLKRGAGRFWEESFWLLGPPGIAAYRALPVDPSPPRSQAFPLGGVYVLRGDGAHLVADCGEVGLRGLGGHGHSDVLSFELAVGGTSVVTDCGAYLYTASREWRNRFRSTAFHNTVQVDGEELNRPVHPDLLWRLRYDAVPTPPVWRPGPEWDYLRAGHRGYERLPEPVTHVREFLAHRADPVVLVRDRLGGRGVHRFVWRFHLDPQLRAELAEGGIRLAAGDRVVWLSLLDGPAGLDLRLEPGWVSASYGVRAPTTVVVAELTGPVPVEAVWAFAGGVRPRDLDNLRQDVTTGLWGRLGGEHLDARPATSTPPRRRPTG
jgi:hypothetical protein